MKLVIQRVKKANVLVGKKEVGAIDKGLFVLVGIGRDDKEDDIIKTADKFLNIRIMADKDGKMNLSPIETKCQILAVSQFTLNADTNSGRRPSFVSSADPKKAKKLYDLFINRLKENLTTETGVFGSYMTINLVLDGPVTIIVEK